MRTRLRASAANWRVIVVRLVGNALALALVWVLLPGITLATTDFRVSVSTFDFPLEGDALALLLVAVLFGLLNAFVKPLLQFLTLPFLLESFGLVIVLVNMLVLWLLSQLAPDAIQIDNVGWLVLGGALLGLFAFAIDNLLGLVPPIIDDRPQPAGGGEA